MDRKQNQNLSPTNSRPSWRPIRVALVALLIGLAPFGAAAQYNYPLDDPYIATATIAILRDKDLSYSSILRLPGLAGRNNLLSLAGRGHVSLALYRQARPAPLLFILPGLGATPYFGVAPYLGNMFHAVGYHVVILPSPMSWNFALAASRSGAPGYAPADARDLYDVMQNTLRMLRADRRIKITGIDFLGFSLGALQGAHLSVIDAAQGRIGIDKYLLINPPLDLAYADQKLDEWNTLAQRLGRQRGQEIISRALAIVDSFAQEPLGEVATFKRLAQRFQSFERADLQLLIAENFERQLAELGYVTQVIHDQGVLSAPPDDRRTRLAEARKFSILDYERKIGLPLWRKQIGDFDADLPTLLQRSSVASLYDRLRTNPKVHIVHNQDDFLVETSAIEALKAAMGDQVTLYPRGGHLGNIWFPANQDYFRRYFKPNANTTTLLR